MNNKDMLFAKAFTETARETIIGSLSRLENSGNEDLVFVKKMIKDVVELKEGIESISIKIKELENVFENKNGDIYE